jgi:DNA-binding transcriptional ArsR family regulator
VSTYQHGLALDALGDPTRRAILELLRDGPRPVGELAGALPVSRPAVSQHLAVLKAAGLDALRAYLEGLWGQALASYRQAADGGSGETEEKGER